MSPLSPRSPFTTQDSQQIHSWPRHGRVPSRQRGNPVRLSTTVGEALLSSSDIAEHLPQQTQSLFLLAEATGYALASYYTSLGLFVISVPGLWSLIKRSVKSKVVQKTFIGEGEGKKVPNQVAGEILSFFTRNNFVVSDRGETIVGAYYWTKASRKEQIKVKMLMAEDGTVSEIVVQGDDQQVEQMRRDLQLSEKGMVYVKGIFER